jgi:hypothetical protein
MTSIATIAEESLILPIPPESAISFDPPDDGLTAAQRRLVELDLHKPTITAYYDELEKVTAAVAAEVGINGYFAASDGTVYKIVQPSGAYITYKLLNFERTKRPGEARGTLSMKEAADARANGFKPLPAEGRNEGR